jgi:hypothetical protein
MGSVKDMINEARTTLGMSSHTNKITHWYGMDGQPWCDMAISYWGAHSNNKQVGHFAWTVAHANWFKNHGQWHAGIAGIRPGDIVFYSWSGSKSISSIQHVGLVERVSGTTIHTIEGNTADAVRRKVRDKTYIVGYGRPKYTSIVTPPPGPKPKPKPVPVPHPCPPCEPEDDGPVGPPTPKPTPHPVPKPKPKPVSTFGLDYAWGGMPSEAVLKKKKVGFVCRYLSHDNAKDLSQSEVNRLSKIHVGIVVVWETTANRAQSGYTAGVNDAQWAAAKAHSVGMPKDRPIYFAVDFDISGNTTSIDAYFKGVNHVLGANRTGVYGGLEAVKHLRTKKLAQWFWQTYAWSGGKWDTHNDIEQYSNGHQVDGKDCDYNRSLVSDFGQWNI